VGDDAQERSLTRRAHEVERGLGQTVDVMRIGLGIGRRERLARDDDRREAEALLADPTPPLSPEPPITIHVAADYVAATS
jgi:hypothetical protein